jgi:hypothetical protein
MFETFTNSISKRLFISFLIYRNKNFDEKNPLAVSSIEYKYIYHLFRISRYPSGQRGVKLLFFFFKIANGLYMTNSQYYDKRLI